MPPEERRFGDITLNSVTRRPSPFATPRHLAFTRYVDIVATTKKRRWLCIIGRMA